MKKFSVFLMAMLFLAVLTLVTPGTSKALLLDADSLTVGTYSPSSPLIFSTAYGDVTFVGEIRDPDGDPEFNTAGASGNVFDIDNETMQAYLTFSFDILSATFIYGGNLGVFDNEAWDIGGNVVDSFFQASTIDGEPAGPITLAGTGIRTLFWEDPGLSFSALDNLNVSPAPVPEPGTIVLMGLGLVGLAGMGRKKLFKK